VEFPSNRVAHVPFWHGCARRILGHRCCGAVAACPGQPRAGRAQRAAQRCPLTRRRRGATRHAGHAALASGLLVACAVCASYTAGAC
jgi:hypothetical protein